MKFKSKENNELIEQEKYIMKNSTQSLYIFIWSFLKNYKWKIYGICLAVFVASLLTVCDSYLLKILIDKITYDKETFDIFTEKKYFIIIVLFILLNISSNLIWRIVNYFHLKIFPEIKYKVSLEIFSYLAMHSYQYFQDNMAGDLANKAQDVSESIEDIFMPIMSISYIFFTVFIAIITAYTINVYFSISLVVWIIFFVSISIVLSRSITSYSKDFAQMRSILNGKYVDSLMNIFSVKIFSRQIFEKQYIEKASYEVIKKDVALRWKLLVLWALQGLLCSLVLGVVVFILIFLHSKKAITTGDFVFIISITITTIQHVFGIAELITRVLEQIGICNQAISVIYRPHLVVDIKNAKDFQVKNAEIVFRNVKFGYTQEKILFKNLNVKIKNKQKVGIVGYSGSGKTSFISLLLRLFEFQQGEILIGKHNIKNVKQISLREGISFIPQNPTLFHRSFKENIRYGKIDASDEEVVMAAKKAHIHECILATSEGYDSLLGENGIKISAGQRQRIAIARAILKNSPILILDEATSSLDSLTEELIKKSLESLMKNKTVIIIAHRLSTLLSMDRILVFDKGEIKEEGTHDELLYKKGLYYKLWSSQVGGLLMDRNNV